MALQCGACGKENSDDARFCRHCGTILGGLPATAGPSAGPSPEPLGSVEEPGERGSDLATIPEEDTSRTAAGPFLVTHRGTVYGLGHGPGFYGIWDLTEGGPPVVWFDRSPLGWSGAWRRFRELEALGRGARWRGTEPGWVILHLVMGATIWLGQAGLTAVALLIAGRLGGLDSISPVAQTALGATAFGALVSAIAGWLLFVYLRRPLRARLVAVLGPVLAGVVALVVVALNVTPPG
ncbi:MAG: zinc ribbon domain-containing protein [Actinobacteria bacterium]|nr:zinc ribbon domain-containing protein [Actinomycetota bacterium]